MRKIVLLPDPEGPTSTTNAWPLTVRLISCTTSTLPKYLLICSKRTLAIAHHSFSRSRRSRHRTEEGRRYHLFLLLGLFHRRSTLELLSKMLVVRQKICYHKGMNLEGEYLLDQLSAMLLLFCSQV